MNEQIFGILGRGLLMLALGGYAIGCGDDDDNDQH